MRACIILVFLWQHAFASASDIDLGWTAYENGDFPTAAGHVATAWESGVLSQPEYIRLLELATCVAFATNNEEAARERAAAIASLTESFSPGASTPPQVLEAVDAARQRGVRFEIRTAEHVEERVTLSVDLRDPLNLSSRVRVSQQVNGVWETADGSNVELESDAPYFVEALDQHGNTIATLATREEPRFAPSALGEIRDGDADGEPTRSPAPWVLVSAGAAVVVAGAGFYGSGRRLARDVEDSEPGTPFPTVRGKIARAERRSRWGASLAVVGLAIVAGGVGWRVMGDDDASVSVTPLSVRYDARF